MPRHEASPQLQAPVVVAPPPPPLATPLPPDATIIPLPVRKPAPKPAGPRQTRKTTGKGSRTHKKGRAIEDYLILDHPTPPEQRMRCLALMMQTTGHSLDMGCRLCF